MNNKQQFLTVSQVAKLYNLANQTIYRHIKSGKLSRDNNNKIILSECLRVYGEPEKIKSDNVPQVNSNNVTTQESDVITLLKQQIDFLQGQLELANERENRLMAILENHSNNSLFHRLFK